MDIFQATSAYEAWTGKYTPLLSEDLELKHQRMAESLFAFLRATFYRWMQLWPQVCPELAKAPAVLAVGDLHVENFGTWRDAEGRLVWGVNDFDEVYPLAWPLDLVRTGRQRPLGNPGGGAETGWQGRLRGNPDWLCQSPSGGWKTACFRRKQSVAAGCGPRQIA